MRYGTVVYSHQQHAYIHTYQSPHISCRWLRGHLATGIFTQQYGRTYNNDSGGGQPLDRWIKWVSSSTLYSTIVCGLSITEDWCPYRFPYPSSCLHNTIGWYCNVFIIQYTALSHSSSWHINDPAVCQGCLLHLQYCTYATFLPWAMSEYGFATEEELVERLTTINRKEDKEMVEDVLGAVVFTNEFPKDDELPEKLSVSVMYSTVFSPPSGHQPLKEHDSYVC